MKISLNSDIYATEIHKVTSLWENVSIKAKKFEIND